MIDPVAPYTESLAADMESMMGSGTVDYILYTDQGLVEETENAKWKEHFSGEA